MHDLMHDLSSFVTQGECIRSYIDKLATIPSTVRHMHIQVKAHSELSDFNLENIRTLMLQFEDSDHPKLDYVVNEIIKKNKSLRVLAVFALKLSEFPKSACDLVHLRYLSLSSFNIKEFPKSMSKLYFLETMVCGGFGIEKPSQAAGLVELSNIKVSEAFAETIAGLGRLTSLQTLSCRVGKNGRFKICELRDMRDLRCLSISNVGGIDSHDEANMANLREKVKLSSLSLQWETDNFDVEVFENLEPHCHLKELKIRNYMGESLPPWITKLAFSKLEVLIFESMKRIREWSLTEQPNNCMHCLRELTIDDCPDLLFLPPLPTSLKKLKLQNLGLFSLPDLLKDHTSESGSLPSLVSLEISECPNLLSLDRGFLQNPEQFTSLEELIIMNCEELETPPDSFCIYISLKRLDIRDCPNIKLLFEHRFSLSSTLQLFRIDNYVEDIQAEMRDNACELGLQSVRTLQTEEAKLVVFDLYQVFPSLELRISSMRSYMGRWSYDWFKNNLSHLEYLTIDGYLQSDEYCSGKLPEGVNQLLKIICIGNNTGYPHKLTPLYPKAHSTTPEEQQIYLVTEHIKSMQCLKRLSVGVGSNSFVIPHFPVTLKELKLSNLGLTGLQSLWRYQSSPCRSLPSLVKIEISDCPHLCWLTSDMNGHEQFAALKELIISNCSRLQMQQKGFSDFISLERLDIRDCPQIRQSYQEEVSHPSRLQFLPYTLQFLRIDSDVKNIKTEMRKNDNIYELSFQSGPTIQTDEAKLIVINHVWGSLDMELRFSDIRNYMGRWPPVWLRQTLSMLESLCIEGQPSIYNYHSNELPNGMNRLLEIIRKGRISRCCFPSLEIVNTSDMTVLEQSYLVTQNNELTQCLKKLTVALWSRSCVMPPLSFTLKELRLHDLGLKVLPNFYKNQSSKSFSFPSLVTMEIIDCPGLKSLAEGLFQNPRQFESLEYLTIRNCRTLTKLPQGGFNKFKSLKKLNICDCPSLERQLVQKCFLPSALQVLRIQWCGDLDATLTNALEIVHSLVSLQLIGCNIIKSLPPKEVFSRWKTLEILKLSNCRELTSVESLLGLIYVRSFTICECPKLVSAITSPSAWNNGEFEGILEDGTIQTSNRSAPTQPTPTDPSCSTNTEHKPLLSVDELEIYDPLLLYIEPIKSLSSVRELTIKDCSGRQSSLPELPFFATLKELRLHYLGFAGLPNLCINQSGDSGSLLPLVRMEIINCSNLVSLAEGLFEYPQQFASLEYLTIWNCATLTKLPQGGFNKCKSLKKLDIWRCPSIDGQRVQECFLPSALQVLRFQWCGDLDATLPKALESVQFLISLQLIGCNIIKSLPAKEVFSRWEALEKLELVNCNELTSLESLAGLKSVKLLTICGCPKLVSSIEGDVRTITYGPASNQPTPPDTSSSINTEQKPQLSVDELVIDNFLLLSVEPIRSISAVRKLAITYCYQLRSLPELPPGLEELSLEYCNPDFRRCEKSGADWPKLSHLRKVSFP